MQRSSLSFKMARCGQLLEWRARSHISSQMTTMRSAASSRSYYERDDGAERAAAMPAPWSRGAGTSSRGMA